MADNTTLNAGSGGDTMATDDLGGGVKVQRVKVMLGADGANDGDVSSANSMPVSVTNSVPVVGELQVEGIDPHDAAYTRNPLGIGAYAKTTAPTAVSADGDMVHLWADRNGRLQVGDGGATLSVDDDGGSLTVDGTTMAASGDTTMQNAAAANGDGTVLAVTGYGLAFLQVSGTFSATVNFEGSPDAGTTWLAIVAAPLGASDFVTTATAAGMFRVPVAGLQQLRARVSGYASGNVTVVGRASNAPHAASVTRLAAGTNNIGDVDVLTVPAPLSTTGGGTEATALRVTLASDSTGVVSVDDNGASLTVDLANVENATLADNAAFTDGTTRVVMSGHIFDETAGTALTENDAAASRINANRATVAAIEDGTTRARYATVTAANALKVDGSAVTQPVSGTVTASNTAGDVAHDGLDSGNPLKVGAKAVAHGANPTAVAAADRTDLYANRAGILFTIGGHPNAITRSVRIADSDGAQTDLSIAGTINSGTKVVVTQFSITCDAGNTNALACKLGFGATTIPADSATGASGVLFDHEGIAPGSGVVVGNGAGIIGVGADGEELRMTCEDPVGGFLCVTFTYYTIES